ncbi:ABC transporter substrate-binding protein [Neobacillus drentensis]|uniref:ABC transporter substrate-binding protein n=1 Tax=Neobacillus drentensis TaxID=220684 RepID=UPI002FFDFEA8
MKKSWLAGLFVSLFFVSIMLTACSSSEKSSGSDKKEFVYAMSGLYKPFNYKENGKLAGFDVEIGEALAKKMGMKPVAVTNPWETLIQGLQAKKFDAILASMTVTDERKKSVNFTDTYYRSGAQIFVAKDNQSIKSVSDLKGKKIGVVKASTYKALALQNTVKENVIEYDSDITALMDLPTGRLDAVITDQMVGLPIIKDGSIKIKDVGEPLSHDDQSIAVRKEDKKLLDKLNKALAEIIKDGTYEKISNKWFGRSILGD